jgi:hypothetical protein
MKVQYTKKINDNKPNLTIDKIYNVINIRRWNNGAVQYLIEDDTEHTNWYSKKRFNNRKENYKE